MSETNAISAQGTIISVSPDPNWPDSDPQGGALDFEEIAELGDITLPETSRNEIETTTHNQQDSRFIVGIRRTGTMTLNLNWLPGNSTHDHHTGLQAKQVDGSRDIYRATFPDGSSMTFSGYVSNVAREAPVDNKLSATVTIRPTGAVQFADAP